MEARDCCIKRKEEKNSGSASKKYEKYDIARASSTSTNMKKKEKLENNSKMKLDGDETNLENEGAQINLETPNLTTSQLLLSTFAKQVIFVIFGIDALTLEDAVEKEKSNNITDELSEDLSNIACVFLYIHKLILLKFL